MLTGEYDPCSHSLRRLNSELLEGGASRQSASNLFSVKNDKLRQSTQASPSSSARDPSIHSEIKLDKPRAVGCDFGEFWETRGYWDAEQNV